MQPQHRDLGSYELWNQSLSRSRRRRRNVRLGRREQARRTRASGAVTAAMLFGPVIQVGAVSAQGKVSDEVGQSSPANRAIAPAGFTGLLKIGSEGSSVAQVQRELGVTVDGIFGPDTADAVRAFQERNGLLADAIVGPLTWGALFGSGAATAGASGPGYDVRVSEAKGLERAVAMPAAEDGVVAKIELRSNDGAAERPRTRPVADRDERSIGGSPNREAPAAEPPADVPERVNTSCGSDRLQRPVRGGVITGDFGEDRGSHRHSGLDIAAPTGTPILAAACGVVTQVGSQSGYGNMVCIKHSSSLTTCYAHMSRFSASVGERVHAGEVIGFVGCTGSCTGPHVHFETRVNGQQRDPAPYLSGRSRISGKRTVHSADEQSGTRRSARTRSTGSSGGTQYQASTADQPGSTYAEPAYTPEPQPTYEAEPAPAEPQPYVEPAPAEPTYAPPAPAPVEAAPAPVEAAPVEAAPVEAAPVEAAPAPERVGAAPVEAAPAEPASVSEPVAPAPTATTEEAAPAPAEPAPQAETAPAEPAPAEAAPVAAG